MESKQNVALRTATWIHKDSGKAGTMAVEAFGGCIFYACTLKQTSLTLDGTTLNNAQKKNMQRCEAEQSVKDNAGDRCTRRVQRQAQPRLRQLSNKNVSIYTQLKKMQ